MTTIDIHCHLATLASRPAVEAHRRPEHVPYDYFMGQDSKDHNKILFPVLWLGGLLTRQRSSCFVESVVEAEPICQITELAE